MGNAIFIPPCIRAKPEDNKVKVLFWGGETRILDDTQPAGMLLMEFPDQIVCHAGSFYIGHPVPSLSIGDELVAGETYFVIPADRLASQILTAGSIASLSSGSKKKPIDFGQNPFEFVKSAQGDSLIKVSPEFITKVLIGDDGGKPAVPGSCRELCSTPELKKHYDQLVGRRTTPWSPKLETISEKKKKKKSRLSPITLSPIRLSPIRLTPRKLMCR